jgi:CSLREA domain-containing protein
MTAAPLGTTIVVNNNGDSVGADGHCTLREAILNANSNTQVFGSGVGECAAGMAGLDNIVFALGTGTPTINLTSGDVLEVTEPVVINGNTGGATRVELNGAGILAGNGEGLTITSGGSTIKGLVINRFRGSGLILRTRGGNVVENCYIGTNAAGIADLGNQFYGIFIDDSSNNIIGGTTAGTRNVISGNDRYGVLITGAFLSGGGSNATSNQGLGNFIGTDVTGTAAVGNGWAGVSCSHGAKANMIGGTVAGARNVISGNVGSGIDLRSFTAGGNQVLGNFIGTDVTGMVDLGNVGFGVIFFVSNGDIVGGMLAGARNIISGNDSGGVLVSTGTDNKVLGNFIGTDVTGMVALGNGNDGGVIISTSGGNEVVSNLISGNQGYGIVTAFSGPIRILGNLIGTDVTGTAGLGNKLDGIRLLYSVYGSVIGGMTAGASNIIAFNGGNGRRSQTIRVNGLLLR